MTKRILSLVAVAAGLATFTPLSVTTSAAQLSCRIPFSFIVAGKTLPPGAYTISTDNAMLMVKSLRASAVVLTNGARGRTEAGRAKMVFLKTGDRYDLIEVWTGDGAGREVLVSRKHLAERALASNAAPERIVIAAM